MTVKEDFKGEKKFINLLRTIVNTAEKSKEEQIARSRDTFKPIYGKRIIMMLPTETLDEMNKEIEYYEKKAKDSEDI